MLDGALLASFEWAPSSLADLDDMPERTLWLHVSYRQGMQDRAKRQTTVKEG